MNRLCSSHTVGADFRIRPKAGLQFYDLLALDQSFATKNRRQLCGEQFANTSTRDGLIGVIPAALL